MISCKLSTSNTLLVAHSQIWCTSINQNIVGGHNYFHEKEYQSNSMSMGPIRKLWTLKSSHLVYSSLGQRNIFKYTSLYWFSNWQLSHTKSSHSISSQYTVPKQSERHFGFFSYCTLPCWDYDVGELAWLFFIFSMSYVPRHTLWE